MNVNTLCGYLTEKSEKYIDMSCEGLEVHLPVTVAGMDGSSTRKHVQ